MTLRHHPSTCSDFRFVVLATATVETTRPIRLHLAFDTSGDETEALCRMTNRACLGCMKELGVASRGCRKRRQTLNQDETVHTCLSFQDTVTNEGIIFRFPRFHYWQARTSVSSAVMACHADSVPRSPSSCLRV